MASRKQAMAQAASKIGTVDLAGAFVWRVVYPRWIGGAWCAAFIDWTLHAVGIATPPPGRTGWFYTPTAVATARANGTFRAPTTGNAANMRLGDVVWFDWQDDRVPDHVAFFEKYLGGGWVQTIEGNTSSGMVGSQSNGRGVWRRKRHLSDIVGFGDLSALYDDTKPQDIGVGMSAEGKALLQRAMHVTQDGIIGAKTIAALQQRFHLTADGYATGGDSPLVRAVQTYLNARRDGIVGSGKKVAPRWGTLTVDGEWGPLTGAACDEYLTHWKGSFK